MRRNILPTRFVPKGALALILASVVIVTIAFAALLFMTFSRGSDVRNINSCVNDCTFNIR